ncbi:hypothetical protein HK099_005435 [Clydaea vesicula]|uniref:Citrate synthase n=1 Tax=Clydaea vesicula TaxID=447962 RepID=A0AAD5TZ72_9FUNG|nr:hypothetical protein HK099_005435 [Clydaea vesicula]
MQESGTEIEKENFLSVTDSITGNTIKIAISEFNTINANAFLKLNSVPLRCYDPGLKNTVVSKTKISLIDGQDGKLYYRGYNIEDLVEKSNFLEVAYLLIYGSLPDKSQLKNWNHNIMHHTYIHVELERQMATYRYDAHPMGMLIGTVASLSTFHPEANPALQANTFRHRIGRSYNNPMPLNADNISADDYCGNIWYMIDKLNQPDFKPDKRLVKVLDKLFILLAENGSNCSTSTMRHLISSGVDPYTALAGSMSALFGERKCHAVIDMLSDIGTVENVQLFLSMVKRKETDTSKLYSNIHIPQHNRKKKVSGKPLRLMGFGHRVYKTVDPRVKIAKSLALEVFEIFGKDDICELAIELEEAALNDEYVTSRKLYPNVDYWTAVILHCCKFPKDMFPVWLAVPRVAGFLAHWIESIDDPEYKIFRPRQIYVGNEIMHVTSKLRRKASNVVELDAAYVRNPTYVDASKRRNESQSVEDLQKLISSTEIAIEKGSSEVEGWKDWIGGKLFGINQERLRETQKELLILLERQKALLEQGREENAQN